MEDQTTERTHPPRVLAYDFRSPEIAARYPSHGWAENSQGLRLLWLPIIRVVFNAFGLRRQEGRADYMSRGEFNDLLAFKHTVDKLVLALRELKKAERFVASCAGLDSPIRDTTGISRTMPLYVDLVYVYLRRLADRLTAALRFSLFTHALSAPHEYKGLRKLLANPLKVQALHPLCDITQVAAAFQRHSEWFDKVRYSESDDGIHRYGIRDALDHKPVVIQVQSTKAGDEPWEVQAWMRTGNTFAVNLLGTVPEVMLDLCNLLTDISAALRIDTAYKASVPTGPGDFVFATGDDEDTTGFWPAI